MEKVMHLIGHLDTGGAETLVTNYALHFSSNVECIVVVLNKSKTVSPNELQLRIQGIKIVNLADFVPFEGTVFRRIFNKYRRSRILRDYIEKEGIGIIHSHLSVNQYVYWATKGLDYLKLFHTVHSEPSWNFGKRFSARIEKFCTQYLIDIYDMRLIALHENMRIELNEMFNVDNTVVINNGIDTVRFAPAQYQDTKLSRKTALGFTENDYVVGHIGRFVNAKNHKFLIDIFAKLCEQKSNAKLLLVGSGELKADIIAQVENYGLTDRVVMLENRKDIPELLSVMDVFVFPSIFEGLGIVLIEAQAMGIKCVVSDPVPKAAHVARNYISLSLDTPVDEWCNAILDDEMKTAPHMSLKDYDMKEIVKQLERLYME